MNHLTLYFFYLPPLKIFYTLCYDKEKIAERLICTFIPYRKNKEGYIVVHGGMKKNSIKRRLAVTLLAMVLTATSVIVPIGAGTADAATYSNSVERIYASRQYAKSVTFAWTAKSGVSGTKWQIRYRYKKVSSGRWSKWTVKTVSKRSRNVASKKNYFVQAQARRVGDTAWGSNAVTVSTNGKYKPIINAGAANSSGKLVTNITITAGKTYKIHPKHTYSNARKTRVLPNGASYKATNKNVVSLIKSNGSKYTSGRVNGTITIKGLKAGSSKVIVRAANGRQKTLYVTVKAVVKTTARATGNASPAAPTGIKATANSKNIQITWNAVSGATGYEVYRSENQSFSSAPVYYSAINKYCDTTVEEGKTYYYKVAAYKNYTGDTTYSKDSAVVSAARTAAEQELIPEGVEVTSEPAGLKLSWPAANISVEECRKIVRDDEHGESENHAIKYVVYCNDEAVSGELDEPQFFHETAIEKGKTYTYTVHPRVRLNRVGKTKTTYYDAVLYDSSYLITIGDVCIPVEDSAFANKAAKKPAAVSIPANLYANAEEDATRVKLTWNANPRAAKFVVERNGSKIAETATAGIYDSNIKESTIYTYTVYAYDAAGNKSKGASVKIITKAKPKPVPTPTPDPVQPDPVKPSGKPWAEWPKITFTLGTAKFYLGQSWTSTLYSQLKANANGYEHVVRKNFVVAHSGDNGWWSDGYTYQEYIYDEDVYMFNTTTYKDFLMVYVVNGQILSWTTSAANMGSNNGTAFKRGDTSWPANATATVVNVQPYMEEYKEKAALMGGFTQKDSEGDDNIYVNNDFVIDTSMNGPEKRIGFHLTNAYRVLRDRAPLIYNKYLDGENNTWTGTVTLRMPSLGVEDIYTFTNNRYGAQAYAETMDASDVLSHDARNMTAGPLSYSKGCCRDAVVCQASGNSVYAPGENVAGGPSLGEAVLTNYTGFNDTGYNSSAEHICNLLSTEWKYIGIGLGKSGMYNCVQFGIDWDKGSFD